MARSRWTAARAAGWAQEQLQRKGIVGARLEAEVLLAYLLRVERVALYVDPGKELSSEQQMAYREMIKRRAAGEPIAYIIGYKEFWSMRCMVSPECLIPRPETEHLVEEVVRIGSGVEGALRILEIGYGCGAVAIALAKELPSAQVVATDISSSVRVLAEQNAAAQGVQGRVRFVFADLFPEGEAAFDIICSNPPYIPTSQLLSLPQEVRDYEPLAALDGGDDGLDFFRRIAQGAPRYLVRGGWLLMEMGKGQVARVAAILEQEGFSDIVAIADHAGIPRVIRGRWPGGGG